MDFGVLSEQRHLLLFSGHFVSKTAWVTPRAWSNAQSAKGRIVTYSRRKRFSHRVR